MAKQLNVDLRFRADTSQVQQQIQQLQHSLTQIASAGTIGIGGEKITAEMKQASAAAKELQMHLSKAMNIETGTLDLNKLNNSLLGAKTNLQSLSTSLLQIGPSGTTAFTQLATAVSQADRPVLALNSKLTQLWTVMKNTMRWQLSSSMLHGFIGGISNAYRYAQDLNESLNNIRIVTGYSAEYMENFALQANKAAKALSTTTNEYTKASLIYFQQGLSAEEVNKRVDVTIKMANVSRQSAEIVSDQLTAVWNNFYDGSKSLEYYADVMTALGAKTASSSDEIAGGLEKFAAIGETIGLSYEYAASALATITANTRQSEEVVGTALKTIFARMQGLKLGETLDDGVELNKYSQALATIGVDIFDANRNLKDMDDILDETAAKWDKLTKAQQTATAQTVAGIRQYNQFIALMDNWNDGTSDSMVANLETSYGATGTLEEQANIYADSWEAARDRVKASAEAIYNALLDDDFFIGMNNMFSGLLDSINGFIDGIGGLKGVLLGAFALITSHLANKLQPMINNTIANFQVLFTGASQQAINLGNSMQQAIEKAQSNTKINLSFGEEQQLKNAQALILAKNKLTAVNKNLSAEERYLAETELQLIQMEQERAVSLAQSKEKSIEKTNQLKEELATEEKLLQMRQSSMGSVDKAYQGYQRDFSNAILAGDNEKMDQAGAHLDIMEARYTEVKRAAQDTANVIRTEFVASLEQTNYTIPTTTQLFQSQINGLQDLKNKMSSMSFDEARIGIEMYAQTLPKVVMEQEQVQKAYRAMMTEAHNPEELVKGLEIFIQSLERAGISAKDLKNIMQEFGLGGFADKIIASYKEQKKATDDLTASQKKLEQAFANFNPTHKFTGVEKITAMGSSMSSLAMSVNMFKSAISAIGNEDMSWGEKLTTIMMSLGMTIPMVTTLFNNMYKMMGIGSAQEIANMKQLNLAIIENQALNSTSIFQEGQKLVAKMSLEGATRKEIEAELEKQGIQLNGISLTQFEEATDLKTLTTKGLVIQSTQAQLAVDKLQQAATNGNILAKMQLWALQKAGLVTMVTENGVKKAKIVLDNAETKSQFALGVARAFANHPLLIALGLLAALIGVVALAVVGIKALIDVYNADAIALEQANAALVEQQKVLQETKAAHEELISTLEKYEEAYNSLQIMTKGTEEWKNQVEELNRQVIDLITKYPKLAQYVQRDGNGVLSLNSVGIKKLEKESDQKVQDAEIRTLQAQRRVNTAKQKNDITNMSRKADATMGLGTYIVNNAGAGATLGGAAGGGVFSIPGAIVGALGGAILGTFMHAVDNFTADSKAEKQLNDLVAGYSDQGESYLALSDTQTAIYRLSETLGLEKEAIIDLIRSNEALNDTNRLLIEQEVDKQFENDQIYQNSKYQDAMRNIAADTKEKEGKITENDRKLAEQNLFASYEDDYSDYLKAVYGDDAKNYQVVHTAGYNATVQKFDEEKKQQVNVSEENGLTQKDAIEAVAQMYANNRANNEIEKTVNLKQIDKLGTELENKYKENGLSEDSAVKIANAMLQSEKVNFAQFNQSDLDVLTKYQGADRGIQSLQQQAQEFENSGGILNANNESYQQLLIQANAGKEAENYINSIGGINSEAIETDMSGLSMLHNYYDGQEAQAQINQIKEFYNKLNDEDKLLFAQTADFKIATNKEMMQEFLDQEKEKQAMSEGRAQAEAEGFDPDVLETQARQIMKNTKGMEDNAEAAVEMALANQRLNKGVDKLTDGWKDWNKALRASDKTTQDYAEALENTKDSLREMFGLTEEDIIPDSFFEDTKNLDLIDQVANGSEEALAQLHFNLTKAQIESQEFSAKIGQNMINAFKLSDDADLEATFNAMKTKAINALEGIKKAAAGIDIGDALSISNEDQEKFAQDINQLALAAGWSAEQMQSALSSVGVTAEMDFIEGEPVSKMIPTIEITRWPTSPPDPVDGKQTWRESSKTVGYTSHKEPTMVPQIKMQDPKNPTKQNKPIFKKTSMGNIAPSVTSGGKSSGGGGGGKKSTPKKPVERKEVEPTEKVKLEDELEKYHTTEKALEDIAYTLEEISAQKEKAWGAKKLKLIQDENKAIKENIDLNHKLIKEATEYSKTYKKDVQKYGGIIDEKSGRLINYEEYVADAVAMKNAGLGRADSLRESAADKQFELDEFNRSFEINGKEKTQADYEYEWSLEKEIEEDERNADKAEEKANELYEEKMAAYKNYTEAETKRKDTIKENADLYRQLEDNALNEIIIKVEYKMELNEMEMDKNEYYLSKVEDSFYRLGEKTTIFSEKLEILKEGLDLSDNSFWETLDKFEKGEGIQNFSSVIQAAQEAAPTILEKLSALLEYDQEMVQKYGELLGEVNEEFTKYVQLFDTGISKLEHYKNLLGLIGKEQDYKMNNTILRSQLDITKAQTQANKEYYETMKAEYIRIKKMYDAEKDGTANKELLKQQMFDILAVTNEAEENYLASLESTGEKANEILENSLAEQRKILEKNLTNDIGLDSYISEIDRFNARQEEYLTNTNKLYETNKLIRQAQMDMDKTDNIRAKQKYNEYIKQIQQLQKQGQLSSYQLSIKQAEFELLQAQIALEEAQDAKNQVRLTRDAEGNYGYVYTANEENIADAEQKVADSENKLYNIGLEGAKDYQSKYNQIMQEALDTYDEINEKYKTGEITTEEEYNKQMLAAKEHYTELLSQYESLYYMGRDLMIEQSYDKERKELYNSIGSAKEFATYTDEYIKQASQAFKDFETDVEDVTKEVGKNETELTNKTKEVDKATQELSTTIQNLNQDVIPDQLENIKKATEGYYKERAAVYDLIHSYEKYYDVMHKILELSEKDPATIDYKAEMNKREWELLNDNDPTNDDPTQDPTWKALQIGRQGKIRDMDIAEELEKEFSKGAYANWEYINELLNARANKIKGHEKDQDYVSNDDLIKYLEQKLGVDLIDNMGYTDEELAAVRQKMTETTVTDNSGKELSGLAKYMHIYFPGRYDQETSVSKIESSRVENTPVDPSANIETLPQSNSNAPIVNEIPKKGDKVIVKSSATHFSRGGARMASFVPSGRFDVLQTSADGSEILIGRDGTATGWVALTDIEGYNTGGYTGAWGPEGKLAVLHEKELILNAQDTENLLASTMILREISQMLDRNALLASLGMADFEALKLSETADQVLQQDVTIHAEFPNVTDHNEIELAIDNLINAASQHAYRV